MLADTKKTLLAIGVGEAAMLWLAVAPDYSDVWMAPRDDMANRVRQGYVVAAVLILSLGAFSELVDGNRGSLLAGAVVVAGMIAAYEWALYQPSEDTEGEEDA